MLKIFRDNYFKNLLTLITGAGISQFLPVLFSPILARLYSPHEFGVLALFMAFCYILGMVSTGMYELSIMLPKKDKTAYNLLVWVIILCCIISVLLFVILQAISLNSYLGNWIKSLEFSYLLPLGVFFTGSFQAYTYWLNRTKDYKRLNALRMGQSIMIVVISLLFGYLGFKKAGLIIGFLLGGVYTTFLMLFEVINLKSNYDKTEIKQNIKYYSNYPKLILPSSLINTTASYAPIFFISKFFTTFITGSYSMATRVLTAPVAIISVIMGQMYYKKMADLINMKDKFIFKEFKKNALMLLLLSVLIFIPLFFFGKEIVLLVLGKQWENAGEYIEILALSTLIKFVVSPLSSIFMATNQLKKLASWQTLYFITTICMFSLGIHFNLEIKQILWIYVLHESLLYGIYYMLMHQTAKKIK